MTTTTNTQNTLILTPNSRLARFLRRQILVAHENNMAVPAILPWQTWVQSLYQQAILTAENAPLCLNKEQESLLWQRLLQQSAGTEHVLQLDATAKSMQQAYNMLYQAGLTLADVNSGHNVDVNTFISIATLFEHELQQANYLASAQLIPWLCAQSLQLPYSNIELYQFDEITLQMQGLLKHSEKLGLKISRKDETQSLEDEAVMTCHDLNDEINTMARFAKALHDQNPQNKILCIIPNLNQIRESVLTTFKQTFFPKAEFTPDFEQDVFNISGGYTLASAPIIAMVLQILSLNTYRIAYQQLTALLTSPFINGFNNEMLARAKFDVVMREFDEIEYSWPFIIKQSQKHGGLDAFSAQIESWLQLRQGFTQKQSLAQWQNDLHQLLTTMGWPGERSLNSEEYQQVQRFFTLLQSLSQLDLNAKSYSYHEVLQLLNQSCHNTLFAGESHDGPIQVLGLLEAAGINSDYCWVMHLDDETWPQAASPNPFLPFALQRQHQMPHSSAERELQFSQQMMQRLRNSSKHLIYSYHQFDADRHLQMSPLLKDIALKQKAQLPLAKIEDFTQLIASAAQIEVLSDEMAPAVAKDEKTPGGSGIFKHQAACPFRAFAVYRLHAEGLQEPESGLNMLERGLVLHACLDKIWAKLQTHANLCKQTEAQLNKLINTSIEKSLSEYFSTYSQKLAPRFKTLEAERLQELLLQWLQFESERPAFKVIAHEQWRQLHVAGLNINLQIDRIDELENGEKIVIDYKSGKTNPASWFGQRPREPQLPLYCISEKDISGISFAQVRIDDLKFKGIAANDIGVKGIKPIEDVRDYMVPSDWDALIREWDTTIAELAQAFFAGDARVDPAFYDTCDYCELYTLCRIGERE